MSTPTIITLYESIRGILMNARNTAYNAVNSTMVQAYWETGRLIVEDEQGGKNRASYRKSVLKELSIKLTNDFGPGFGEQALRYYRQFFLIFPIRAALRRELTWTHYRLLIRVLNPEARNYYLQESAKQQWNTRTLERNINLLYLPTEEELQELVENDRNRLEEAAAIYGSLFPGGLASGGLGGFIYPGF